MNVPRTAHSVCALDCPDACSLLIDVDEQNTAAVSAAIPTIPSPAAFSAAKWPAISNANIHPLACSIRSAAPAPKAKAASPASPGTKRSTKSPTACTASPANHGPESILPYSYAGTMGLLNGSGMDRRFFHRLGASRLDRTICSTAGMAGMTDALGLRYAVEPEQFRHAKLIIAWGANILGTNVHLWPFIVEARRNGAQVLYDRSRTRTAPASSPTATTRSTPAPTPLWRSRMMHVILAKASTTAITSSATPSASTNYSARVARMDPAARRATHRHPRGRHRRSRARIRHHATRRHSPELRRAAFRTRRHGGPHHRPSAGSHRRLAETPAAAFSSPPPRRSTSIAPRSKCPDLQQRAGREARIVNMTRTGPRAHLA